MASMDSKADFGAMMNELDIPEKARQWIQAQGFRTISVMAFTFVQSTDGNALLQQIPNETWTELGFNPATTDVMTTVVAGKLRRLLAQCRMVVQQFSSSAVTSTTSTPLNPVTSPVWHELAPPRLTPEAVAQMVETFQTNDPEKIADTRHYSINSPPLSYTSLYETWASDQVHPMADQDVAKAVPGDDRS